MVQIATLLPFLDWLYPACAGFGPFFLIMGVLARTAENARLRKSGVGWLIIGGIMVAFCLWQNTPMGVPAPK